MTNPTTPTDPAMTPEEAMREAAASILDTHGDSAATNALGQQLCCNGYHCGCQGATVGEYLQYLIRALPLSTLVVAHQGAENDRQAARVNRAAIDAAYAALPPDACGTIAEGEMERVLERAFAAISPTPGAETHPDDLAVDRFAVAMKAKMARSRAKGRHGWNDPNDCTDAFLVGLLRHHITKTNAGTFEDIGCLAMMLHQRGADPAALGQPPAKTDAAAIRANAILDTWEYEASERSIRDPIRSQIFAEAAIMRSLINRPQPTPEPQGWRPTHRHVKRGSEYRILARGQLQTSGPMFDYMDVTVYQDREGKTWVRSDREFFDGRFEALPAAPMTGEGE